MLLLYFAGSTRHAADEPSSSTGRQGHYTLLEMNRMQKQYNDAYEAGMVNADEEINWDHLYVIHRMRVRQGLSESSGDENSTAPAPYSKK